ncbi:MAG TPA: TlyA family RNA methyltransferase [Rhizomicrobium sp.]|nr:TlyA family RNA methyltransferase [Rhizomicrobium sp.]
MKMRADLFLVRHGHARSRAEAQAAIAARSVHVDGRAIARPSQALSQDAKIEYAPAHPYVSRGALKLAAALERFALSPAGLVCLDLGASTGGFTQVLLERGAKQVFAVDVGRGQLHQKIADDRRVVSLEGVNARELSPVVLGAAPQAVVADVSFISLTLALPRALAMAPPRAWLVALVKPQFEAGKESVGKGGIVRDRSVRLAALGRIVTFVTEASWSVLGTMESPIEGGDGNREFLLAAAKP